jgi:hypothetical protein|tara:strand:+ start:197 stop:778 length:582 start_codon:yes stop_codon:yes gene_type:complete
MNIFVLSTDPIEAAIQQCDKHVPKMLVESGQMLSTAHRVLDGKLTRRPSKSGKTMVKYWDLYEGADDLEAELLYYKAVHVGHPCTKWSMESDSNYRWHWEHMKALANEYTYRYGKIHKTERELLWQIQSPPRNIPKGPMTPFKLAMKANPECMFDDPVKSYRAFYQTKQYRFPMVWTKRPVPEWFQYADLHAA